MFPGMGGMNPKKMQGMLKQLGISQEEIHAEKVTIEKTDGASITITNPSVYKVKMQGQETFQVTGGEISEGEAEKFNEEDVNFVAEKTGKSKEEARKALAETQDIAEAIMKLSE